MKDSEGEVLRRRQRKRGIRLVSRGTAVPRTQLRLTASTATNDCPLSSPKSWQAPRQVRHRAGAMVDVVEALQRTVLFHVKQPARIPLKQLAAIRAPVTEPHVELTPKPRAPTFAIE